MKKRKTIAIVTARGVNDFHGSYIEGIIKQAWLLDYDVAVFSLFSLSEARSKHQDGEENIYNLINYDKVDGIIFFDSSFWIFEIKQWLIAEFRKKSNGNVVFLDSLASGEYQNVVSDDMSSFALVVDHFIEVHNCKKIYCLTGPKNNMISEVRLQSYKAAMRRHGLEVKDEYCIYGDFWEQSGADLAHKIISGEIEKPDAVVCGNDIMALSLCNTLIAGGMPVPDEVLVAGYDFCENGYNNIPAITSCLRADRNAGARCVCKIHKKITGQNVKPYIDGTGMFFSGESCGCTKKADFARVYGADVRSRNVYMDKYVTGSMLEKLMGSENYDDFVKNAFTVVYMLRGFKKYSLCLNENWNEFSENDDVYCKSGYNENMFVAFSRTNNNYADMGEKFRSEDMFPPGMLEEEHPIACFFNPLHFGDRCFGFEAVKFESHEMSPDFIYRFWTGNINAALEYVRAKERLSIMYNKAYSSSLRDGMTGIYNRFGCDKFAAELYEKAVKDHKRLLIAVADLDNLKKINDTYGHQEGDNALTVMAQAIQYCSSNGECCARTGGDEFIIIGCGDYIKESPEDFRRLITNYLDRYNAKSDKEYKVETSLGFYFDYPDGSESFSECQAVADERMYLNKSARKKGRLNT